MNYLERDTLGIYRKEKSGGPGPALMGQTRSSATTSTICRTKSWETSRKSCWT